MAQWVKALGGPEFEFPCKTGCVAGLYANPACMYGNRRILGIYQAS